MRLEDPTSTLSVDVLPEALPVLTPAHNRRLRQLWSHGRPVHAGTLGGLELDLLVHRFIALDSRHAGAVISVTGIGVCHLNSIRQARVAAQQPHHSLGSRLAAHLRGKGFFTWENVQFQTPGAFPKLVRPDVYACRPSLLSRNAEPAIYEVKVSRADFLADIARPEKREAYRALAQAVYYCAPADLISGRDLPAGCGLVEELRDGSFVISKRARRLKTFSLTADIAMTLMVKRQSYGDDPLEAASRVE